MNIKAITLFCAALTVICFSCKDQGGKEEASQTAKQEKPNIIYILTDDLGHGDLGCYGQETLKTPHIDKMAEEGIMFTQHYAGSSVCAPSRASLMTGRDNGHSRVRGNYETGPFGFGGELELRPEDTSIPEVLKTAGYNSAMIGKWGLGMNGTTGEPDKKGFNYYYGFLNQAHAHSHFPEYLFRNGEKEDIPENKNGKRGAFSNHIFTDEAVTYIKNQAENKDEPFFLYLSFITPHAEMIVPEDSIFNSFKGRFDEVPFVTDMHGTDGKDSLGLYNSQEHPKAAFASMITHIDNDVNRVLELLKTLDLDENTVVMFSSDNGPHEEGGNDPYYFNSNGENRGIKRDLYEGGIKVPFIVRWPGIIEPNQKSDHVNAFWDILPTLAEIADADMSQVKTEGVSLVPTLLGESEKQKNHEYLYWEFHEKKYTNQAVRKDDWKVVRHDPDGPSELYNLKEDPLERNNIADQYPAIVKEMEEIMITGRVDNSYFPMKRSGK